ncbi:MAG: TetR/AcrR family transcriptional regulator [Chloroflexota bacterium]
MSPRRARVLAGRVGDDPAVALRDHLVDAAATLIGRSPLALITTREIARAAGVSDGVLYNYFGDKNDLLVEALVRQFRRTIEAAAARIPEPGTATLEANLESIATTLLDVEREVIPMIAGLVADPALLHRMFVALHDDPLGPHWFRAPLIAYLEGERRLGRVRSDANPDGIVLLLMGSTSILALAGHLASGTAAEADRRHVVVDELLRGLRPG